MAPDAPLPENTGNASDAKKAGGSAATQAPAVNGNGGSRVGRGVAAALAAAALGTAVAAAAKSRGSSGTPDTDTSGGDTAVGGRAARAKGAVKRGEPVLAAAWTAARGSLEPITRSGSRRAGELVAEHSPDFVRENVIPPFVEGLTEARPD